MGLQKYRADAPGEKRPNGGTPYYANWMGGPTLALVKDCPVSNMQISPRTVYVRGEPLTFSSLPAACVHKRKSIHGVLMSNEQGYYFVAHLKLAASGEPLEE